MKKKIFVLMFFIACFSMIFIPNFQQNVFAEGFFDLVFDTPSPALGDYVNNLIMVNFAGEDNLDTYAENTYDIFNTAYNTSDYSLNKYYNTVSNSKLNLQTQIVTDTQGNVQTLQLQQEREYFMNYMFRDSSNNWHTNTNGYFGYELVQSSKAPESELDFEFYMGSTHKYFVYDDSKGAPVDNDTSDGIISLSYAQTLMQSNSNYYVVNSFERYLRELKLMKMISLDFQQYVDFSKADQNDDGNVDIISLNIIDNPQKNYRIEWSELLWAHQSTIGIFYNTDILYGMTLDSIISAGGYMLSMAKSLLQSFLSTHCYNPSEVETYIECIFDRPCVTDGTNSLYIDKFFLNTLDCSTLANVTQEDICTKLEIGTVAHELGHLFGLPDLYLYPSNSTEATSIWSLMCSSGNPPQYLTAYERYLLGWLDTTNNIKTITTSGDYVVNATKGYDGTSTIAFVVQGTGDYSKQYFYFEHRNKNLTENYFEKNIGDPGLLCYRIDTSVVSGNMNAKPYGLYVFSETGYAGKTSSLTLGESFGNYDIRQTDKAFTYQKTTTESVDYVNAGICVEVKQLTSTQLTFNISLFEKDHKAPQIEIVNGNKTILYGETYTEDGIMIYENGTQIQYELSQNLSGVKQYKIEYFKTNESFEEQSKVTSISTTQPGYYIAKYTVVDGYGYEYTKIRQIIVEEEKIEITNLDEKLKNALKTFTGLQTLYSNSLKTYDYINLSGYNLTTIVGLEQFSFKSNVYIDLANNNLIDYSQIATFANTLQSCKISVVANNIDTTDYVLNSKIIFGIQKQKTYKLVEIPIDLQDLPSYIDDFSADYTLYHNNTPVSNFSAITALTYGTNTFMLKAKNAFSDVSVSVCYIAFEQTKTSEVVEINSEYNFVESDWVRAYGASLSNFEIQNTINTIDFTTEGKQSFTISIIVDSTQKITFSCEILVQNQRVIVEDINQVLLDRILEITNQTIPYQDILQNFDYIDLSALNLESMAGLEKFVFKQNAIIDFASNNISLASDIQQFLSQANTEVKVLVAGNKLTKQESDKLSNNVVVALQQLQTMVVYNTNTINTILPIKYDFDGVYELYINNQKITSQFVITKFETFDIKLTSQTYHNVSQTLSYVAIYKTSQDAIEIDYKQDIMAIDPMQYFAFENIDNLQIEKTYDENNHTLKFDFVLQKNILTTLSYSINIIDNDKPTITLDGDQVVYVTSKQQYIDLYSQNQVVAFDQNDGECEVITTMPEMSTYGIYTIEYKATDKAGNQATIQRIVHIGNIEFEQIGVVEYKTQKVLNITFTVFEEQDFKISYSIGESEFQDYNAQNGITFVNYGEQVLRLKASSQTIATFVIEKQMQINVKDSIAPTIQLVGNPQITLSYGQTYTEQGFVVVDNCGQDEISKTIEIKNSSNQTLTHVDTFAVGEYTITYKATDKGGNTATITRKVIVSYEKVDSITIIKPANASFEAGKEINLKLNIQKGEHSNPNPTILWYVDGQLVETTTALSKVFVFENAGTYSIKAVVAGEDTESNTVQIKITEIQQQSSSMLPLVIAAIVVVGIVAGILISIVIKRRRSLI